MIITNDLRRLIRAYDHRGLYLASPATAELPIGRHRATDPEDDQDDTQTTTTETQPDAFRADWWDCSLVPGNSCRDRTCLSIITQSPDRLSPQVAEATTWLAHDWPDTAANRRAGGEG